MTEKAKTHKFQLRVSDEDWERWRAAANAAGCRSLSAWVRDTLDANADAHKNNPPWPTVRHADDMAASVRRRSDLRQVKPDFKEKKKKKP